jgi:hypothetical protein
VEADQKSRMRIRDTVTLLFITWNRVSLIFPHKKSDNNTVLLGTVLVSAKTKRMIYSVQHINSYISKKALASQDARRFLLYIIPMS